MTVDLNASMFGLLSEIETLIPGAVGAIDEFRSSSLSVDSAFKSNLAESARVQEGRRVAEAALEDTHTQIRGYNADLARVHQELAALKRRVAEIGENMARAGEGPLHRRLRRERARQQNQIEDREAEATSFGERMARLREELPGLEERSSEIRGQANRLREQRDVLQASLPQPELYTQLFELQAAQAHCAFRLDQDTRAWSAAMRGAMGMMASLHQDLHEGKYRLDRNSQFVAGRALASAETMYASLAVGDRDFAAKFFAMVVDPDLYFHHIFHVFRIWAVGLWLDGRHDDLAELLEHHQFADGLRGGYVTCFRALLNNDSASLSIGLRELARHHRQSTGQSAALRGLGALNVPAIAIARLAREGGMDVSLPDETVPASLAFADL